MIDITPTIKDLAITIDESCTPGVLTLTVRHNITGAAWCGNFPASKLDKLMTYMNIARVIATPHDLTYGDYYAYSNTYDRLSGDLHSILKKIPTDFISKA